MTRSGQVLDAALVDRVSAQHVKLYGRFVEGQWHELARANDVGTGSRWYDSYGTTDGKFLSVGALQASSDPSFIAGISLCSDEFSHCDRSRWPEQKEEVAGRIRARTGDKSGRICEGREALVAPALTLAGATWFPHNRVRLVFVSRAVLQPSPAATFSRTKGALPPASPHPGADTAPILFVVGFDHAGVRKLRDDGAGG
jgi:alpha-methylacyl-CoA racemase